MLRWLIVLIALVFAVGCGDSGRHERALLEETRAMRQELREALTRQTEVLEQLRVEAHEGRSEDREFLRERMVPHEEVAHLHERLEDLTRALNLVRETAVTREEFHHVNRRLDEIAAEMGESRSGLERVRRVPTDRPCRESPPREAANSGALGAAPE
jgi:multidrug resistance efflux pump